MTKTFNVIPIEDSSLSEIWMGGYKAASKGRMYSEEDVVNIITAMCNETDAYSLVDEGLVGTYVKSFQLPNKLPKQVELEMESSTYTTHGRGEEMTNITEWDVKIHNNETNTINPIKLIYE